MTEQEKLKAALAKWADGELLSLTDHTRILQLIARVPLQIEQPNVDQIQANYLQLRQILQEKYIDPNK